MTETQNQILLALMRVRWLTPIDALRFAGTMKLATRVGEIRQSLHGTQWEVEQQWRENNGKRFMAYRVRKRLTGDRR